MTLLIKTFINTSWRVGLLCTLVALLGAPLAAMAHERVLLKTSKGAIEIELDETKAPITVANFLKYVDAHFYDGLTFHRVIDGFMIQAGGYDVNMTERKTNPPIANESKNGLSNAVGTVAMARTGDPDSATAQFYINVADNKSLDYVAGRPGYAVFGKVTSGMDIVKAIAGVETGSVSHMDDVPLQPVVIISARRVDSKSP
jgi:cyclophilin family peptidyl-prolyl cis-trans isomerase